MNDNFAEHLSGGDLRSIGNVTQIIGKVVNQTKFDKLFHYLFSDNRLWVMRSADAIEKISKIHPDYLGNHKSELFALLETARDKELKWHLALILPRLHLSSEDCTNMFIKLSDWAMNSKESKIVRVNCLAYISDCFFNKAAQGLYNGYDSIYLYRLVFTNRNNNFVTTILSSFFRKK